MSNVISDLDTMQAAVKQALRLFHKESKAGSPFQSLRSYRQTRGECRNDRQATNQILTSAVEALAQEFPLEAKIIVGNHFDGNTMRCVAHQNGLGESAAYERKAQGIAWLAQYLLERERARPVAQTGDTRAKPKSIPVPEDALIGVERHVEALWEELTADAPPHIFALVGMGGIGKTTLAQLLLQRLWEAGAAAGAGWVSAKPANFALTGNAAPLRPALTTELMVESLHQQIVGADPSLPFSYRAALEELNEALKAARHYIVIDNLETVFDLQTLLPVLRELRAPSRFILTTRDSLLEALDVRHYTVPPLSEEDALALVRLQAGSAGLHHLANLSTPELRPIYRLVGGNPLALRLIVGQSRLHDLSRILRDLERGKGKANELYSYVYWRAWDQLNEGSRLAWLATPTLPASGGTYEEWLVASGLSEEGLDEAITELVGLNLVDRQITAISSHYSIHGLTRTFLMSGIAGW